MKHKHSYVERRRFLCGMVGGGAAALGATVAGPLGAYVGNLRSEPPPDFLVLTRDEYDVAPGESRIVSYGPLPALVLRTPAPQGELRVFVALCTHLDCIVGYERNADTILCACHEGRFDLEGRVVSGPPPAPLRVMHFIERDGKLFLALEKKNLEKAG
jgi:Rieske Fe-S protein